MYILQNVNFVCDIIDAWCFFQTDYVIKQDVLNFTIAEWRKQEVLFYESMTGGLFHCPACQDEPHTIHIDGNAKLFRYKAAGR